MSSAWPFVIVVLSVVPPVFLFWAGGLGERGGSFSFRFGFGFDGGAGFNGRAGFGRAGTGAAVIVAGSSVVVAVWSLGAPGRESARPRLAGRGTRLSRRKGRGTPRAVVSGFGCEEQRRGRGGCRVGSTARPTRRSSRRCLIACSRSCAIASATACSLSWRAQSASFSFASSSVLAKLCRTTFGRALYTTKPKCSEWACLTWMAAVGSRR